MDLNNQQRADQAEFRQFVRKEIEPEANDWDQKEHIPLGIAEKLAHRGYLCALLPEQYGGRNMDMISYGLLNEELGRGCASIRGLVMLQNMIASTLLRWGSPHHKDFWLERIATGKAIAAFALTEPEAGSDAMSILATARQDGRDYILNGTKTWISMGQIAHVFLTFAKCEGKLCAFLVPRETPGLSLKPISGMLGIRASMLAEFSLGECRIPEGNLVGGIGFGFDPVGAQALNTGRYSVAWGCIGIAQACLEASLRHTSIRMQFGVYLNEHQLIRQMIADMIVNINAARLLCLQAGHAEKAGSSDAYMKTMIAKYFASRIATKVSEDAVQIHGALGCSGAHAVQRHMRDAKIMEIIEGTTQIHQIKIAEFGIHEFASE